MQIYSKCQGFAPISPSLLRTQTQDCILGSVDTLPWSEFWKLIFQVIGISSVVALCTEQQLCCEESCPSCAGRQEERGPLGFGQSCHEVLLPVGWEKSSQLGSSCGRSCWELSSASSVSYTCTSERCLEKWRKKKKKSCMCPLNMHLFLLLVLSLTLQAALSDLHFALGVVVSAGGEQAPTEGEL